MACHTDETINPVKALYSVSFLVTYIVFITTTIILYNDRRSTASTSSSSSSAKLQRTQDGTNATTTHSMQLLYQDTRCMSSIAQWISDGTYGCTAILLMDLSLIEIIYRPTSRPQRHSNGKWVHRACPLLVR